MAWVPQRPHLFARSIADNVRLGRPDATDHERPVLPSPMPGSTMWWPGCPRDSRPCWAPRAPGCRRGSDSGSLWRGRSCGMRPFSCSTSPRPISTARPRRRVLSAVRRLMVGRTVVMAAHRPSLLAVSDRVVSTGTSRSGRRAVVTPSDADRDRSGELAPVGRTLAVARPASRRVVLATLLGAGAIAADIGLLGTAAWLISKAAQHPNEATLAVAIVAVQFFGLSRGLLAVRGAPGRPRCRLPAARRPAGAGSIERLERLAPAGLPAFRRGDLLARMVQDVDSLQDLVLRVVPPFGIALVVGVSTVVLLWWMLPAAAVILAVSLVLAATVVPWLTGWLARRREARFAAVRGDLGAAMVDLTEGAAELIAFGAADAHLQTDPEPGCGADRHRLGLGRDRGYRAGADDAPGRAGLLGLSHGRHPRRAVGPARRHGVGRHHAHPPGRLRAGGRSSRRHPSPAAGASGRGAGLRGPRRSGARVRSRGRRPAPRRRPTTWRCGRCGPRYPDAVSPALRDVDLSLPPGGAWRSWDRAERASRPWPRCSSASCRCRSGSITLSGVADGAVIRRRPAHRGRSGRPGRLPLRRHRGRQPARREARRHRRPAARRARPGRPGRLARRSPQGLAHRGGRRTGPAYRGVSANGWPWPAPCWPTSRCSCSTSRPSTSSLRPPTRSTADLLEVTDGRSLVLITHRLAGLESVDEILVMEHGRVVATRDPRRAARPGGALLRPLVGGDADRALRPIARGSTSAWPATIDGRPPRGRPDTTGVARHDQ